VPGVLNRPGDEVEPRQQEDPMKHYIAKMLRRVAQKLDPQPEPAWYALYPTPGCPTATNVASTTYAWKAVGR
jgi:hypothetical protein